MTKKIKLSYDTCIELSKLDEKIKWEIVNYKDTKITIKNIAID